MEVGLLAIVVIGSQVFQILFPLCWLAWSGSSLISTQMLKNLSSSRWVVRDTFLVMMLLNSTLFLSSVRTPLTGLGVPPVPGNAAASFLSVLQSKIVASVANQEFTFTPTFKGHNLLSHYCLLVTNLSQSPSRKCCLRLGSPPSSSSSSEDLTLQTLLLQLQLAPSSQS